jgi:hypothetical protein
LILKTHWPFAVGIWLSLGLIKAIVFLKKIAAKNIALVIKYSFQQIFLSPEEA